MIRTVECPLCGRLTELDVPNSGFLAWQDGSRIQDALPMLTADEREVLMTGICPACWDEINGEGSE